MVMMRRLLVRHLKMVLLLMKKSRSINWQQDKKKFIEQLEAALLRIQIKLKGSVVALVN
jgi:hypothetical protein